MENPSTVKEAFKELNKRLYYFESESYLLSVYELYFDCEGLIANLIDSILPFNRNDILEEAKHYEVRAKEMFTRLKDKETEGRLDENENTVDIKPISDERKEYLLFNWKYELLYYTKYLKLIQANNSVDQDKVSKETVINLPNDFQVSTIKGSFDPQLTLKEAALFFHYLEKASYSPKLSAVSKGKLASPLFGVNAGNVDRQYSDMDFPFFPKDLDNLKNKLNNLISLIDNDIELARKTPKSKRK